MNGFSLLIGRNSLFQNKYVSIRKFRNNNILGHLCLGAITTKGKRGSRDGSIATCLSVLIKVFTD